MDRLNTIGKAIKVLELINREKRPLSVKEIASLIDINKSSIHHHLKTLCKYGFLQQNRETRDYDIGYNLLNIGLSFLNRQDITQIAHPYLVELNKTLGFTLQLLIRDNLHVVYLDKVDKSLKPGTLTCNTYIGQRSDLHSTAAGKLFLSQLSTDELDQTLDNMVLNPKTDKTITGKIQLLDEIKKIRRNGYATELEENSISLQCLSYPIFDHNSNSIAVVNISNRVDQMSMKQMVNEILPILRENCLYISREMGYNPHR